MQLSPCYQQEPFKRALTPERAPIPYFGQISCTRSKFTQMSAHAGGKFLSATAWRTVHVRMDGV